MRINWFEIANRHENNRGVSPVIATILVVAIVVIISASIAAVTFGYTDQLSDPAPTTAFEFDHEDQWEITHTQGESINADALQIRIDDPDGVADNVTDWPVTGTVSAGTSVKVGGSNTTGNEDVSVIWEDGSSSYSIGSTGGSSGSGGGGSSGSGGGGGAGVVASIGGSFADDPTTSANEITATVVDGAGDPVENEEITISVVATTQGTLTAYDSSDSVHGQYQTEEQITVRTGSSGEFETAIGGPSEGPLGKIRFFPNTGASGVSYGDTISIKLESSSTSVEQTITYEYN